MKIIEFMTILLGFSAAGLVRRRISGRKWPWYTVCIIACIIGFGIGQNTNPPPQPPRPRTVVKYRNVRDRTPQTEAESLGEENESRKESLDRKEAAVRKMEAGLAAASSSASSASQQQKESGGNASPDLSALDYSGTQVIDVNGGNPGFSSSDLSTANGAWQQYHDLDAQNRVTGADAMLNQSLMPPRGARKPLRQSDRMAQQAHRKRLALQQMPPDCLPAHRPEQQPQEPHDGDPLPEQPLHDQIRGSDCRLSEIQCRTLRQIFRATGIPRKRPARPRHPAPRRISR